MEKGHIVIIILVIALICCGAFLVLQKAGLKLGGDTYITYQVAADGQASTELPGVVAAPDGHTILYSNVHNGEIAGTTSLVKSMDIYAEPMDWDSSVGKDGVVVHLNFYDEYGRKVIFSGETVSLEIEVYGADSDTRGKRISPRNVLYKGYSSITSSDQGGELGSLAGIRIAFSDLSMTQYERGMGLIKISASMPNGGFAYAEEELIYVRNTV